MKKSRTRTVSPWKQCPTEWRHCASCRQARLARQLGEVTVRGQLLEAWQCTDGSCELIWCLPVRSPLMELGEAA